MKSVSQRLRIMLRAIQSGEISTDKKDEVTVLFDKLDDDIQNMEESTEKVLCLSLLDQIKLEWENIE